jgi:hypothetical protein
MGLGYLIGFWLFGSHLGGGLGLVLGSIGTYFLGIYLNQTKPARDLATHMDARAAQLYAQVDAGTFYRGPGYPMPISLADARQQADALLLEEYAVRNNTGRNLHKLYFIPVQYFGIIGAVGGIAVVILQFVK